MALSPEDVIKKSFKPTHLKRGYDETEVDDFLDEIVVELRRLGSENTGLRTDLDDCRAGRSTDSDAARVPVSAEMGEEQEQLARVHRERDELVAELDELSQRVEQRRAEAAHGEGGETTSTADGELARLRQQVEASRAEVEQARTEVEQARADAAEQAELVEQLRQDGTAPAAPAMASAETGTEESASIIALARRVHDEHVAEGEATRTRLVDEADTYRDRVVGEADERSTELVSTGQQQHEELVQTGQTRHDELVTQGQSTHDRLVGEGEQTRDTMISEAEQQRTRVLADLTSKQNALSGKIEELTYFESDYRGKLRGFLSEQLGRLDEDEEPRR